MTRRAAHPAFTLTELLLVIGIFVLLLAVAVPAFSGIARSSTEATALSRVSRALGAARDLALRQPAGRDTAAVFLYQPGGAVTVLVCTKAGEITDEVQGQTFPGREVFVPAPGAEAVALPDGWWACGYVPAGALHDATNSNGWYDNGSGGVGNYDPAEPNWVLPETDFYDRTAGDAGRARQSFMVRFEGGTGRTASTRGPALVLVPSESDRFRTGGAWGVYRADLAESLQAFVQWVTAPTGTSLGANQTVVKVLGDQATDTVLAGAVTELALFDSRRMLSALRGSRMNRQTGSIYEQDVRPRIDVTLFAAPVGQGTPQQVTAAINAWLERRLVISGKRIPSDARLLAVDRYRGAMRDIVPIDDGSL